MKSKYFKALMWKTNFLFEGLQVYQTVKYIDQDLDQTTCLNLYTRNGLFDWCTQVPELWLAENFTVYPIVTLRPCIQICIT